jgi:hypothetical protein
VLLWHRVFRATSTQNQQAQPNTNLQARHSHEAGGSCLQGSAAGSDS